MSGWRDIATAPKDGTTILLARYAWLTDVSDLGDDPRTPEFRDRLFDENAPKVYHLCWTCGGFWSSKWNNWNDGVEPCGLSSHPISPTDDRMTSGGAASNRPASFVGGRR